MGTGSTFKTGWRADTQEACQPHHRTSLVTCLHDIKLKSAQALHSTTVSKQNSLRRIKLGEIWEMQYLYCLDLCINLLFRYLLSLEAKQKGKRKSTQLKWYYIWESTLFITTVSAPKPKVQHLKIYNTKIENIQNAQKHKSPLMWLKRHMRFFAVKWQLRMCFTTLYRNL